jgi:hypothetical protein
MSTHAHFVALARSCSAIIASFGGLLMMLVGDQRHLIRISLDQKIYALVKKVGASSASR